MLIVSLQWVVNLGFPIMSQLNLTKQSLTQFTLDYPEILIAFDIHILNPEFVIGFILGGAFIFYVCAILMYMISKNYRKAAVYIDESLSNSAVWDGQSEPKCWPVHVALFYASKRNILLVFYLMVFICGAIFIMD